MNIKECSTTFLAKSDAKFLDSSAIKPLVYCPAFVYYSFFILITVVYCVRIFCILVSIDLSNRKRYTIKNILSKSKLRKKFILKKVELEKH